jgi:hypothetical protein
MRASSTAAHRLANRARASWPLWLGAAILVSGYATVKAARAPSRYAATVVLRVTEGRVAIPGAALGAGRLRTYVNDLALSNTHLIQLMKKYWGGQQDPAGALEDFRKDLQVVIAENDFNEERAADDPPRSARLELTFHSIDPDVTYSVVQDLAELVINSAFGHQRETLEREHAAAVTGAARAEAAFAELKRLDPMGVEPYAAAVQRRVIEAKESVSASTTALRALEQKQALRFEVVDPGRVPPRVASAGRVLATLAFTLLGVLLSGALLAGTYDPRVVDSDDLRELGAGVLGRVPALPERPRRVQEEA